MFCRLRFHFPAIDFRFLCNCVPLSLLLWVEHFFYKVSFLKGFTNFGLLENILDDNVEEMSKEKKTTYAHETKENRLTRQHNAVVVLQQIMSML